MNSALVDPRSGRVAQIVKQGSEFVVASPLVWVPCDDVVAADEAVYDGTSFTPKVPAPPVEITNEQGAKDAIAQACKSGTMEDVLIALDQIGKIL